MVLRPSPVLDLPVTIPPREVLRSLGYPRNKGPSARVGAAIEAMRPVADSLVSARGAFAFASQAEAQAVGMPSPSEHVALGVCTIGAGLEEQAQRLSEVGDALGALVLDAYGSVAAEQAAEVLHARVCVAVQGQGLRAARRISPGYGKWALACQQGLLARLPTAEVGVRLTDSSMMIPRKSVSFAVFLAPPGPTIARSRCDACDLFDCTYRRDKEETSGIKGVGTT
jgi:hypothetical protein